MDFITKDSGERVEFSSGMRRDSSKGKPSYDLIPLFALKRWAELLERGASKYGRSNWTLANSPEEYRRFRSSAMRHFMQYLAGEEDEDHYSAVLFNLTAMERLKLMGVAQIDAEQQMPEPPK